MATPLWPSSHSLAVPPALASQAPRENLPSAWLAQVDTVWLPLAAWVGAQVERTVSTPIVGIHGGQGSGKSTLSRALADWYHAAFGWHVVVVSIDDLYLPHQQRQTLAETIHPLLATRGVPGTHDVRMGIELMHRLRALTPGQTLHFPKFHKLSDDRLPQDQWHQVSGKVDLILFEGWCVACPAQSAEQLHHPINDLERHNDAQGVWRTWVNQQLQGDYQAWFALLDQLIMLQVPDMHAVYRWRQQQERDNRAQTATGQPNRSLDDAALQRFIQHYQRLTEHALKTLPKQADVVLTLNAAHQVNQIQLNAEAPQ
ncbi:hypothetical protein CHH28_12735 [Bacterioplanes sanyensis]|uniref:Kinase n=1 Tax=Bacterioplanes sanyensis TaxID=1249553 RepID=A0A222FLU1_9GAMM|nr:hypothetical protein [Bacterioplanes sanyensis]ASP39484.1 hypothetical protein CHH28_12735 [Bacterioplanes sanyensis]